MTTQKPLSDIQSDILKANDKSLPLATRLESRERIIRAGDYPTITPEEIAEIAALERELADLREKYEDAGKHISLQVDRALAAEREAKEELRLRLAWTSTAAKALKEKEQAERERDDLQDLLDEATGQSEIVKSKVDLILEGAKLYTDKEQAEQRAQDAERLAQDNWNAGLERSERDGKEIVELKAEIARLKTEKASAPVAVSDRLPTEDDAVYRMVPNNHAGVLAYDPELTVEAYMPEYGWQECRSGEWKTMEGVGYTHWRRIDSTPPEN
jgi:hypothetical protein